MERVPGQTGPWRATPPLKTVVRSTPNGMVRGGSCNSATFDNAHLGDDTSEARSSALWGGRLHYSPFVHMTSSLRGGGQGGGVAVQRPRRPEEA